MLPTIPVTGDCVASVFKSPHNNRVTCLQVRYGNEWYVCQLTRAPHVAEWLPGISETGWLEYQTEEMSDTVLGQMALNFATELDTQGFP